MHASPPMPHAVASPMAVPHAVASPMPFPHAAASLPLTAHGRRRLRQRGIPERAVDLVLAYGVRRRTHGATSVFLDRAARRALARQEGDAAARALGHKLDIYVVVADDGALVTAAYRDRPARH